MEMTADKYLDLESRWSHQPGLEPSSSHPYQGIEVQSSSAQAHDPANTQQSPFEGTITFPPPVSGEKISHVPSTDGRPRILVLTTPTFWGLLIIITLVLGGAIGGGIGGGLATRRRNDNSNMTQSSSAPGVGATATGGNNSVGPLPVVQPWTVPQDGGCPIINGTLFTPKGVANGTATENITLQGQVAAQTFVQLCETDFPEGDANPGLRDLYTLYVTTFEECMTTCAEYNRQFQQLRIKTQGRNGTGEDWYCLAASIVKEGEYICSLRIEQASKTTLIIPR
ncbi:hypothetical protein PG990_002619 [Apiospora arundinis]